MILLLFCLSTALWFFENMEEDDETNLGCAGLIYGISVIAALVILAANLSFVHLGHFILLILSPLLAALPWRLHKLLARIFTKPSTRDRLKKQVRQSQKKINKAGKKFRVTQSKMDKLWGLPSGKRQKEVAKYAAKLRNMQTSLVDTYLECRKVFLMIEKSRHQFPSLGRLEQQAKVSLDAANYLQTETGRLITGFERKINVIKARKLQKKYEQKSREAWTGFSQKNEESFWKQYEDLLKKSKETLTASYTQTSNKPE